MLRRLRWKVLNTKQRRHEQIFFCILAIGFLTTILNFFLYHKPNWSLTRQQNQSLATACHCSQSSLIIYDTGECFFNELICYPGFTGDDCELKIINEVNERNIFLDRGTNFCLLVLSLIEIIVQSIVIDLNGICN